uniref:NPH3 domain-containing protein n=1 Tax=Kalanchoe fedtschenkoi TaxID=63787 RepID=A0A7N0U0L0_KALFE
MVTTDLFSEVVSRYSGWMRSMMNNHIQLEISGLEIDDFPGGSFGFELVTRFCYSNGQIEISMSNVAILHCCAVYLDMTEEYAVCNLLRQTEAFLDGMLCWTWSDVLMCLKASESVFEYADSCGLVDRLVCTLVAKVTHNSDPTTALGHSPSSFSSSPESLAKSSSSASSSSATKAWWFDNLTILGPKTIESLTRCLGSSGSDNHSLLLTEFLFHYLKSSKRGSSSASIKQLKTGHHQGYGNLAETAIHGVLSAPKGMFTCRKLFWALRLVSSFSVSKDTRLGLECLIGGMLDKATLDDLLVSGSNKPRGAYDVNLVLRLTKMFVDSCDECDDNIPKMKKAGRLIDRYLGEISPDHNLKVSKFLKVAESLPDCARDCFDGVYRAIDIYLESHPSLSSEERAKLCRCLKYEKLSLEVCKYLAKNPKIPPTAAVEALKSQPCSKKTKEEFTVVHVEKPKTAKNNIELVVYKEGFGDCDGFSEESEDMRKNIKRMQRRVVELEEVCKEMKSQMWSMARKNNKTMMSNNNRSPMPRLC